MIRVTIELIPFGIESGAQHMHTIEIANDGTGDSKRGNYKARIGRRGTKHIDENVWQEKVVTAFPRRSKNVLHLLSRVLHNLGYK